MKKFSVLLFVTVFIVTLNSIAQNPTLKLVGKTATGQLTDETILSFAPGALTSFDVNLDAYKKFPSPPSTEYPLIYTVSEGDELAINNLPSLTGADVYVNLGFKAYTTGNYIINVSALDNFDANTNVFLIDAVLNTKTNLKNVAQYAFQMDANAGDRFTLLFTTVTNLKYWVTEITSKSVVFNYEGYANATKYVIRYAALPIAPATDTIWWYKNGSSTSIGAYIHILADKNYIWQVKAYDANGIIPTVNDPLESYGPYQYFKSGAVTPAKITVTTQSAYYCILAWDAIAGATKYTIKFKEKGSDDATMRYKSVSGNPPLTTRKVGQLKPNATYVGWLKTKYTVGGVDKISYSEPFEFTTSAVKKSISNETSVNNVTGTISPNPTNGLTTITYNSSVNVNITDITGRIVYTASKEAVEGVNNYVFDLSGYSKGLYIVSFTQNDTTQKIKLIVE